MRKPNSIKKSKRTLKKTHKRKHKCKIKVGGNHDVSPETPRRSSSTEQQSRKKKKSKAQLIKNEQFLANLYGEINKNVIMTNLFKPLMPLILINDRIRAYKLNNNTYELTTETILSHPDHVFWKQLGHLQYHGKISFDHIKDAMAEYLNKSIIEKYSENIKNQQNTNLKTIIRHIVYILGVDNREYNIKMEKSLGTGQFGKIYEGTSDDGSVALKSIDKPIENLHNLMEITRECLCLKYLQNVCNCQEICYRESKSQKPKTLAKTLKRQISKKLSDRKRSLKRSNSLPDTTTNPNKPVNRRYSLKSLRKRSSVGSLDSNSSLNIISEGGGEECNYCPDSIKCKNIIQYYGIKLANDNLYISMKYIPKGSLANTISTLSNGDHGINARKIISGVANGLQFLHRYGVYHLDIAPRNILLEEDYTPVIADFGISVINPFSMFSGFIPAKGKFPSSFHPDFFIERNHTKLDYNQHIDNYMYMMLVLEILHATLFSREKYHEFILIYKEPKSGAKDFWSAINNILVDNLNDFPLINNFGEIASELIKPLQDQVQLEDQMNIWDKCMKLIKEIEQNNWTTHFEKRLKYKPSPNLPLHHEYEYSDVKSNIESESDRWATPVWAEKKNKNGPDFNNEQMPPNSNLNFSEPDPEME